MLKKSGTLLLSAAFFLGCGRNETPPNHPPHEDPPKNEDPQSPQLPDKNDPCFGVYSSTHTVRITKYGMTADPELRKKAYNPREITIARCDAVVWLNEDNRAQYHTATADASKAQLWFNTGGIAAGTPSQPTKSRAIQFKESGEFTYHCQPHPWMRGKIAVTP